MKIVNAVIVALIVALAISTIAFACSNKKAQKLETLVQNKDLQLELIAIRLDSMYRKAKGMEQALNAIPKPIVKTVWKQKVVYYEDRDSLELLKQELDLALSEAERTRNDYEGLLNTTRRYELLLKKCIASDSTRVIDSPTTMSGYAFNIRTVTRGSLDSVYLSVAPSLIDADHKCKECPEPVERKVKKNTLSPQLGLYYNDSNFDNYTGIQYRRGVFNMELGKVWNKGGFDSDGRWLGKVGVNVNF